jgi:hypothetical protein
VDAKAEMAVILIIEQHQAPFSAFEPTALQHDDSVSTNLPFSSPCVVTSLKLKHRGDRRAARRQKSSTTATNLCLSERGAKQASQQGRGELAASRIC